jgi:hypothetical protein
MSEQEDRVERADAVMDALRESEKREILDEEQDEVEETAQRFEAAVDRTRHGH